MIRAANPHIGADPDRNACSCASISAGKRPWRQGDSRPDDHCALHVPDINTEFRDRAGVMFRSTRLGYEGAVQITRRAQDIAKAAGRIAGHHPDRDVVRLRRRSECHARYCYKAECAEYSSRSATHCVNLLAKS
jgi:hypothetical protein